MGRVKISDPHIFSPNSHFHDIILKFQNFHSKGSQNSIILNSTSFVSSLNLFDPILKPSPINPPFKIIMASQNVENLPVSSSNAIFLEADSPRLSQDDVVELGKRKRCSKAWNHFKLVSIKETRKACSRQKIVRFLCFLFPLISAKTSKLHYPRQKYNEVNPTMCVACLNQHEPSQPKTFTKTYLDRPTQGNKEQDSDQTNQINIDTHKEVANKNDHFDSIRKEEVDNQNNKQLKDKDSAYPINPGRNGHQYDSSGDEDDSLEDHDYEDEMSSETGDDNASVDSEGIHNEDPPNNQNDNDKYSSDDHVDFLVQTFCSQSLVNVNITSEFEKSTGWIPIFLSLEYAKCVVGHREELWDNLKDISDR
ncbi:hypothetical protein RND71_019207 [Anisodus tanguticus]|uniref:Uncharacterized protein n=1 Tax=Anisodus tanguticus TaxID=243964 RepID=A0AAE1RYZ1_9SOLA|nr:hypothetical protein RND71_019207 [Anisodus tanguticus]